MIKYLGSKRRLVPVLESLLEAAGATSAIDLFTGTTRVAQAFKRLGTFVTAVDSARYSEAFARCYVETDAGVIDAGALRAAIGDMNALPGRSGYFTQTFCVESRFFRPENGERVDAIRDALDERYGDSPLYPVLLTSLIEAADRVDSTAGVQMAYMKQWAPRALNPLELRVPPLLPGIGRAIRGDACSLAGRIGPADLAYLDPPYNQHRYFTNYHIWETLVAWDHPEHYGVACKRLDARSEDTRSAFNRKSTMPGALARIIGDLDARLVVLSYNDEAWISLEDLLAMAAVRGHVRAMAFPSKRYVGAQIGIHDPSGRKVGRVGRLHNTEYVLVAGEIQAVRRACEPLAAAAATA